MVEKGPKPPMSKAEISEGYDEVAEQIRLSPGFYRAVCRFAVRVEPPVLDIGCGGGHLLLYLKEAFGLDASQLYGIDLSARLCTLSAERRVAAIVQGDAERLPFKARSFRTVFLTEVLEHLLQPERCFAEIKRVLTDDGLALVTVPNLDWPGYAAYLKRRRQFQPVDDRFYRLVEMEELARQAGFAVARVGGFDLIWHGGDFWKVLEWGLRQIMPGLHTKQKRLLLALHKSTRVLPKK
jgi:ubiquinone/menaquinone biosynthesis C-methylase UbiE